MDANNDSPEGLDPLDNSKRFLEIYTGCLTLEFDKNPQAYWYTREKIPAVAARVCVALATLGVATFTPAMRKTCVALGIKPNERAAGAYLLLLTRTHTMDPYDLDPFTRAYIECGLWTTHDDDEFLDARYSLADLAPATIERAVADCAAFQTAHADDIAKAPATADGSTGIAHAGHDLWLTRNGHGAGYWDGDYPKAVGERLTEAARALGGCDFYVGDDDLIYSGV